MGRAIIVGDVHGCSAELRALLDRLAPVEGDTLVFVGDLVARGPDSLGVLDVVRESKGLIVRGNHEDRLLAWHRAMLARARGEFALAPDLGRLHHEVAHSMRTEDWELLEQTPVTHFLQPNKTLVVHAGLVPGIPIEQQDPATMMRIRSVGDRGEARDHGGATPWGARYVGPPHVVFGHAASLEAQLHPFATASTPAASTAATSRRWSSTTAKSRRPLPSAARSSSRCLRAGATSTAASASEAAR